MRASLRAEIAGLEKGTSISGAKIYALAQRFGLDFREVMIELLDHDIWPERFKRNMGPLSAAEMRRLLDLRVFIAGCGGLGGALAALLARVGVGKFRLCDPDVFEESNLNRQMFCNEKTLGQPKAAVVAAGLLDIASYLEIEALEIAATPENLPTLLKDVDIAVDCLDSIKAKKMLEAAANKAGTAFLHGSVAYGEGLVWLDSPARNRMSRLYPLDNSGPMSLPVLADTVWGTSTLMCCQLMRASWGHTPILHFDLSVPELEAFPPEDDS